MGSKLEIRGIDEMSHTTSSAAMSLGSFLFVYSLMDADVEFGRIQARDLLQHLWTGPISNAPVEIIQVRTRSTVMPLHAVM
jgi:trehalose 6-phosphate synthase/phosphatase